MKLLHFGFAVKDIERTAAAYKDLFGIPWDPVKTYEANDVATPGAKSVQHVTHGYTSDGTEIEMVQLVKGASPDTLAVEVGISRIMALRCAVRRASKSLEFISFISVKWRVNQNGTCGTAVIGYPRNRAPYTRARRSTRV